LFDGATFGKKNVMKAKGIVVLAAFGVLALLSLVSLPANGSFAGDPFAATSHPAAIQEPAPGQHETPIQSVNGKVVAISKTGLTLEVVADGKSSQLDFIIDESTQTEGDIKPGTMATVDYQTKDSKKYAVHIMPAEAKKP
jgi:hypothetical protein